MFVYQNNDGNICVTFADTKPVSAPEYIIEVDEAAKALYVLSDEGRTEIAKTNDVEYPDVEEVVDIPAAPAVEELDSVVENDYRDEFAPNTTAENISEPTVEELDVVEDNDHIDTPAENTEAVNGGAPTVEELDGVEENDPVEEE